MCEYVWWVLKVMLCEKSKVILLMAHVDVFLFLFFFFGSGVGGEG